MPENEVPEWMLSAMRDAEERLRWVQPYVEQAQRNAESIRSMMPALQYTQRYAADTRRVLEIARSAAPVIEYTQRHAEQARQALASAELLFTYADRLAMDTGLIPVTLRLVEQAAPPIRTASANLTGTPTLTVQAEMAEAAETDVDAPPETSAATPSPVDYGALAIKLLWSYALILPLAAIHLSPGAQQLILFYLATISIALIVNWRYNDTRKK
jgi:hypothetical protein